MLPPVISAYLPHIGLLMLLLAIIFEIISAADYTNMDPSNPTKQASITLAFAKYHNLALIFAIIGVALLVAGSH